MKRDVLFLGMDIVKEAKKLHTEFQNTTTDEMNEEQMNAYNKGVADMLYCIGWLLDREYLSDGETFVVHVENLEMQTELFKKELFKIADKRGYDLPECE